MILSKYFLNPRIFYNIVLSPKFYILLVSERICEKQAYIWCYQYDSWSVEWLTSCIDRCWWQRMENTLHRSSCRWCHIWVSRMPSRGRCQYKWQWRHLVKRRWELWWFSKKRYVVWKLGSHKVSWTISGALWTVGSAGVSECLFALRCELTWNVICLPWHKVFTVW